MKFLRNQSQPAPAESVAALRIAFRRQLWKCMFFALAAVAVVGAATIAWFVANSQVHSGTSAVSAHFEPLKLATKGTRQESDLYLNLPDDKTTKKMEYQNEIYFYTDGDPIALRLDADNYEISPGARGKVTFYVIPSSAGGTVTLQIGLGGYGEIEKEENKKEVVQINDPVLNALMSGHILLFKPDENDPDENNPYAHWLFQDGGNGIFSNTITVDLSKATAGEPYEVNFYWIWPLRYENLEALVGETFCTEQTQNMTELSTGYRYSRVFLAEPGSDLSDSDGKNRSKAYDMADEYIGGNAQYLYLTIQTLSDNTEGGPQP